MPLQYIPPGKTRVLPVISPSFATWDVHTIAIKQDSISDYSLYQGNGLHVLVGLVKNIKALLLLLFFLCKRRSQLIYRTLPTSIKSSTATNSSFPAKLLLGTQVQCISATQKNTTALAHCSCLTIKDFAVQAEMVAVETFIDVGNILCIFYDCLS